MDRFVLFGGERYYESGGWNDFISSHPTLSMSVDIARGLLLTEIQRPSDIEDCRESRIMWWHILDTQTYKIVAHSDDDENGEETDRRISEWLYPNRKSA